MTRRSEGHGMRGGRLADSERPHGEEKHSDATARPSEVRHSCKRRLSRSDVLVSLAPDTHGWVRHASLNTPRRLNERRESEKRIREKVANGRRTRPLSCTWWSFNRQLQYSGDSGFAKGGPWRAQSTSL